MKPFCKQIANLKAIWPLNQIKEGGRRERREVRGEGGGGEE